MACETFKVVDIPACPESIAITDLKPTTNYGFSIEDKFNQRLSGVQLSDYAGVMVIPVNEPDRFREFSGAFKLRLTQDGEPVQVDGYDCLVLYFYKELYD